MHKTVEEKRSSRRTRRLRRERKNYLGSLRMKMKKKKENEGRIKYGGEKKKTS